MLTAAIIGSGPNGLSAAIVLAAAGHNEKAKEFLELAASGKLLPEERALIAKAEESLRR